jgi:hypothetical protein
LARNIIGDPVASAVFGDGIPPLKSTLWTDRLQLAQARLNDGSGDRWLATRREPWPRPRS